MVQTLWLSTSVLERWCYCGTDFVAEYWCTGAVVVQTLWLSTSVLEWWCYCSTDFVAEYWCTGAVVLLWHRLCG